MEVELENARNAYKKAIYNIQMRNINNLIAKLSGITDPTAIFNISNIIIDYNCAEQEWQISYTHTTNAYSQSYYTFEESKSECPIDKVTQIRLSGIKKKYKIYGNGGKFNIYTNSLSKIRIILCQEEDYELDAHEKFVRDQLNNYDMPEYFALRILTALSEDCNNSAKLCEILNIT